MMTDFSMRKRVAGVSTSADSDFYRLFTSFVKGKVSHEILNNCQLLYKCKTCQEVLSGIQHYVEHFERCELLNDNVENGNASIMNLCVAQMIENDPEKRTKKDHACPVCGQELSSNYNLNRHYTTLHSNIKLKCMLCEFQASSITMCITHAMASHNKEYSGSLFCRAQPNENDRVAEFVQRTFKCKLCNYESTSGMDCRKHARIVHKRNTSSRKNFFTIFSHGSSIEKETIKEFPPLDYVSAISNTASTKDEYCVVLDQHEDKVNYDEIYCILCRKKFRHAFILRQHLAVIHLGHKRYKCRQCEFTSTPKNDCKKHMLDAHNVNCLTIFEFRKNFREIKVVTPGLTQRSRLSIYSPLHQKSAKMKKNCEITNQKKDSGETLNNSVQEELDTNKTSADHGYCVILDNEHKEKVDFKSISCLLCKKTFSDNSRLRQHLAVMHLGFERYKCKLCEFKSNTMTDCTEHALTVHKISFPTSNEYRKCFYDLKCVVIPGATNATPIPIAKKDEQKGIINVNVESSSDGVQPRSLNEIITNDSNYVVVLKDNYENIVDFKKKFCLKCNQNYCDNYSLRQHLAVSHLGFARYKCRICEFMASISRECREHISEKHNIEIGKVSDIKKYFRDIRVITPGLKPIKKPSVLTNKKVTVLLDP